MLRRKKKLYREEYHDLGKFDTRDTANKSGVCLIESETIFRCLLMIHLAEIFGRVIMLWLGMC